MEDKGKIISIQPRLSEKKQARLTGKKELSVRVRELEEVVQRLVDRLLLQEEEQKTLSDRLWKVLRLIRKQQEAVSEDDGEDA